MVEVTREKERGRVLAHLSAVWLVGCVLTGVQFSAVFAALFSGGAAPFVAAVVGVVLLAVAALAGLGRAVRTLVPLTRRARGAWAWAACVYTLGTAGAFAAAVVSLTIDRWQSGVLFYPAGGACYALAAALFLPGARVRLAALGAATALAAGGAYAAWAATQPPTLSEWLSANGVDRAMLRVGEPPPGYTLHVLGASEDGFGAEYERSPSARLHLGVRRAGYDTRRVDAHGCPVPFGEPIHCTDDGEGRQLVTYHGAYKRHELRLRHGGLVYTVTVDGPHADLPAARHLLSTLRPATDAELAGLTELPMRR
ncbi:hypothetical protein WDH52_19370 [Streptomyces sp. TRM70308]|uniref:hypothetical protein n=1 Tax=Streptomyces sp. TRM70308 TaxID=3131932 RepID=UPI003D0336B2